MGVLRRIDQKADKKINEVLRKAAVDEVSKKREQKREKRAKKQ